MEINFTKIQGLGNDFIVIDCMKRTEAEVQRIINNASLISDRHFGVGADGLLLVLPSSDIDYRMRIINSDGSEPEMCGNGIRCFGEFIRKNYGFDSKLMVETLAGPIELIYQNDLYTVNMGKPILNNKDIPVKVNSNQISIDRELEVNENKYHFTAVSMGNPHCVIFAENIEDIKLSEIGPLIESHPFFPNKTNVEFIKIKSSSEIDFRVWERGCGETLACGTGACAAVAAGMLNGSLTSPVLVHLPGGDLTIQWDIDPDNLVQLIENPNREKELVNQDIFMKGPAKIVFSGQITI